MSAWIRRLRATLQSVFFALVACYALHGCGRFGVKLFPATDSGTSANAGDSGRADAGGDDAGAVNTGPLDSGAAYGSGGAGGEAADSGIPAGGSAADSGVAGSAACPTLCENAHGTADCSSGKCLASCELGYADCDATPVNGCEASTGDSVMSCGGCGIACENANGTTVCAGGLCSPTCTGMFGDCDADERNGCEADLNTAARCGACDLACSNLNGTTSCNAGVCMPVCSVGYDDCDIDRTNGCETNTMTDPSHCGSCANACGSNGQICVAGACQASPCAAGLGECDGDLSVTCETDINTSLANCGFCSNACTTANGTPKCTAGMCGTASCNATYADCDADPATGCEVPLNTTTAHCGSCAVACTNAHGTTTCASGTCVPSCGTGYGDCDSSRPNGCETPLNTTSNCGTCGKVCPANGGTAVCNSGVCGTVCNLTGTFALKLTVAVSWASRQYVTSGSGTVYSWSKLQGTHSGNSFTGTLTECGKDAPDFSSSVVSERYKIDYPNTLFDHVPAYEPSTSATVTLSSASPGATYALAPLSLLMGASMADPINGTWPSSASGLTSVDMDANSKPGMSATYRSGSGDTYPLTSASFFGNRADLVYVAARTVFSLNGTLSSCTQSSGSASVTHIDTRILGCRRSGGTTDCSSTESNFLDNNHVVYSISSATYSLIKIADAGTCADARAALP